MAEATRARNVPAAPLGLADDGVALEICRVPFLGGAEQIALNCAQALRAGGGQVIMACPPGGSLEAAALAQQLEVHAIRPLSGRRGVATDVARALQATAANRRTLRELASRRRIQIVHAHHPIGAFQAAPAVKSGAALVLHVHETLPVPRQYALLAGWLKRRCDAFVCVSDAGRGLLRRLGVEESRVHVIYNAFHPAFLEPADRPDLGPGPHIGVFGMLEPRKGQADLISALARLGRSHPAAQLWIVGDLSYGANADYLQALRALAAERGIAARVHFTGYCRDVRGMMAAMDVVALASREFESLPTVLLEAAALGRRIVATDVGGVREIVRHGATGIVTPPSDEAALAQALAIALSPAAQDLGEAARIDACTRFAPARFQAELLSLFGEIVQAKRRPAV